MRPIRAVFLGDGAVGKTCLLITQASGSFPTTIETQNMDYNTIMKHGEKKVSVTLIDTIAQEEGDRTRLEIYPATDIFCLCFSIISPYSFENIRKKWYSEITRYAPGKPVILVGCKVDLRSDEDALERLREKKLAPIAFDHANNMKEEIKAYKYVECSSAQSVGLDLLMEAIVECAVGPLKENKKAKKSKGLKKKTKSFKKKNSTLIGENSFNLEIIRSESHKHPKDKTCSLM
eukprot:TRINITY_DN1352_c1_g1_i1.p1 TRINITY_DN1352_c1_g1~~TRINITY_DN1352_c1_g1_i1.p1  ORF type:complete len:233 (-),score=30.40 TRINITY_DN1352_c1_g1_i1:76-774(-)